jgi:biopolymer transport protein ExbB
MGTGLPTWIIVTQWLSRSILAVLLFLSVWSVATMIRCFRLLQNANGPQNLFSAESAQVTQWIEKGQLELFKEWAGKGTTLYAGTGRAILQGAVLGSSQVDRAVRSYLSLQRTQLEGGLTILATLGSNAPFIGLFGTVLGIIQAFGALGAHQNNTSDIMVGISEALFATAVGLFVAIPAVVAFNVFSRKLRVILVSSESLKDLYLSKLQGN